MKKSKEPERKRGTDGKYEKAEVPTKNGHYMGRFCGFDFEDGKYFIAQTHAEPMARIIDREAGLYAMIAAHNKFVHQEFSRIVREKKKWWASVMDDYGLEGDWHYLNEGGTERMYLEKVVVEAKD